jgi:prophage tail gpP-like protein
MSDNILTLTANGVDYTDWTAASGERALDRCESKFDITVTDRAVGAIPWALVAFTPVTLKLNGKLWLTGYIDNFLPYGDANAHSVRITGRSKTADLVDCSADIKGGQFAGYTLDAICRSVCQPFGIDVVVQADMGEVFANVQLYRHEKCFAFLERLCRLRGVLASDDESGNLLLTTAGASRAAGSLQEGGPNVSGNIKSYSGQNSGVNRFSHYAVLGQRPVDDETSGAAANQVEGQADDAGVPRYRPHVVTGESALDPATAQLRAEWQARYNAARGTEAHITVPGWQQPDKSLWKANQIVSVHSPRFLKLDRDLLVYEHRWKIDASSGSTTELGVGPQEGWTPDPGEVKRRKVKGQSAIWTDAVPVTAAHE